MKKKTTTTDFCLCESKDADQFRSNCEADHAFVFAAQIVLFLILNPTFQAFSQLLRLHKPVL